LQWWQGLSIAHSVPQKPSVFWHTIVVNILCLTLVGTQRQFCSITELFKSKIYVDCRPIVHTVAYI
jgi:hypothetical protein